jgi:hypothetical protein
MIDTVWPQTGAGRGPLRPSRYWYLLAGGLLAAAVACLTVAVIGMFSWDRQIQDFQRVRVPGNGEVTLTQPGGYVLYVETRGACCSWTVGNQGPPWSMRIAMGPVKGGQEAPISNWTGTPVAYDVGGHQGVTAMSFTITQPGTYLIETSDVHPASVTDLAVGRNILGATLLPLAMLLAGLAFLLGAVVSAIIIAVRRRRARRGAGQPADVMGTGPWPPAGGAPASGPVLVGFAGPAGQGRATVLFRAILAIPQLICLYFVRQVAGLILITAWFAALFTGRLPDYAVSFLGGFQRWEVRTYAYLLLLTDTYPPFGFLDDDYPVFVTISPGRVNRAAVLFRLLLVFPAWVVATILWYGLGPILMIPAWLIVLVRGRMPQPLYEAIAASLRYWARVKAYWYMLTGVYPDGLFGDPAGPVFGAAGPVFGAPEPVFGGAGPAATWGPPATGPAAAWAPPDISGQEPPYPGAVPADQPVPLPADTVVPGTAPAAGAAWPGAAAGAGATAGAATPGRLVLSRPGKRLVGLILGIGIATPVALFVLLFALAAQAPSAAPAPGSVAAAASAGPSPAPARSSALPVPPLTTGEWLQGLSALSAAMTHAMVAGNGGNDQVLTSGALRSTARQLGRCSAGLAALGPPTAQLRQVDRLAVRACRGFEQGGRYFAAAANFMNPDGSATDQGKVNELLDRGDAGANSGSNLMSRAVADGSIITPTG